MQKAREERLKAGGDAIESVLVSNAPPLLSSTNESIIPAKRIMLRGTYKSRGLGSHKSRWSRNRES